MKLFPIRGINLVYLLVVLNLKVFR